MGGIDMLSERKNIRLPYYDYHTNGMYFVTVCTKEKEHLFGEVIDGEMHMNAMGKYVARQLQSIDERYFDVQMICFIVMPNHIHGIIGLLGNHAPSLGRVVNKFKGLISHKYGRTIWQRGYFEHVVRSERDFLKIWELIYMNRIQKAFDEKKKVFIGFVTAGDPNLATTKELVRAMIKGGAGLIEFGIPFSDPVAEGEVIQKADMRALAAGTTTDKIFDLVAELREETQVPLVFLTYANPIYAYGAEKFFTRCEETGVDGVIIPDIPYEEREEMRPFSEPHHVALVPLIAPTSKDRIQKIAAVAQGYVYVVSSLGVTGVRSNITTDIDGIVAEVRKATDIPVAVGFGIAAPEQAYKMAKASDGAIVGSAIEKIVAQYGEASPEHVYEYVKSMSEAVAKAAAEA